MRSRRPQNTPADSVEDSSLSRREFVVQSGAGLAAGVTAASPALGNLPAILKPNTVDRQSEVRLAWIGVGGRGTTLLKRAINQLGTAKFRVVAVCDIAEPAMQRGIKLCEEMDPAGVKQYEEVLEMKEVDAVFIATPVHLHREMAVAAAQAGKHCYCEKPLGRTAEEVQAVYEAVKKAGIRFQVGFQWRYHVIWQETIAKIQAGEIGKVHFISASRHVESYPSSGWYIDRKLSGDIIVEQAVHEMNIFCWLLQGAPLRACGFGGISALKGVPEGRSIMDHYSVSYEFPHNVTLSYSHCLFTAEGIRGLEQTVMGNKTAADLISGDIIKDGKRIRGDFPKIPDSTERAIASFVGCCRDDKEPLANVDAGRNATLMAILGRIAIHEKREVEWKEVAS